MRAAAAAGLVAALLVAGCGRGASDADARARPNLLLITADTLRADHLGCYGYPRATSPQLDRLAASGLRFAHAVTQFPKTSPSIATLFTGLYVSRHGLHMTRGVLAEHHRTAAEALREAGYATHAIATNANLAREYGFAQGFEGYVEVWRDHPEQEAQPVSDAALAWLRRRARDSAPFFLWLHYSDPHARYIPPAPYREMFVGDVWYDPARRAPLHAGRNDDVGGSRVARASATATRWPTTWPSTTPRSATWTSRSAACWRSSSCSACARARCWRSAPTTARASASTTTGSSTGGCRTTTACACR